ncbi:MAG: RNA-guided endonuclease IscB, partial [Candidatus Heimdallarchaeota archaeon]
NMSVSVMVWNMRGQPLMPTTPQKARKILKQCRAKVIQRTPFTIQLQYTTGETTQPITLGIDAGYGKIGFSAVTAKQELIAGEVHLRMNIPAKLTARRQYRRTRRSNKTRYRPPRFNNRERPKGWLAPSMQHKLQSHLRLIRKFQKLLPMSQIIVEVATFDPQKLQNPEIRGIEYQHGTLADYEVKEYLLHKWGRNCAYCGKTNIPLEIEHIIPKSRGGSNRESNLTISCRKCNLKKGNRTAREFGFPKIQAQAQKSLKMIPFMNLVRSRLVDKLNCEATYGFITKYHRIQQGLSKSHVNDAFIIAGGTTQVRSDPYLVRQSRRNNRQLQKNRKGFKPAIRRQRYPYQPHDLIRYNDQAYRVNGTHCKGSRVIIFAQSGKKKSVGVNKIEVVTYGKGFQFLPSIPPPAKAQGFS